MSLVRAGDDIRLNLTVLEKLQHRAPGAEIWWDSSPLDYPEWRDRLVAEAGDSVTRRRWQSQLDRFLVLDKPELSLVRGVTTNPSLIAKSVLGAPEVWVPEVHRQIRRQALPSVDTTFWLVYEETIRRACVAMLPLWQHTDGEYGWVCGQLDPRHMFDQERMLDQAMMLAQLAPNLMVKVPCTRQGNHVIEELVARGISVNGTLSYTVPQFVACIRAVEAGLATARRRGSQQKSWRCVITHMTGRFGSNGDLLDEAVARGIELTQTDVRWAEVAVLKEIDRMITANGHPVKMLLSSLEVDSGAGTLSMHLELTAGGEFVYTCKPGFVAALTRREHELADFDPAAIEQRPPREVLGKLMRLPYFRRAIDPQGMRPDEFATHGAFMTTYAELNRNTRRMLDFITHEFERKRRSVTILRTVPEKV